MAQDPEASHERKAKILTSKDFSATGEAVLKTSPSDIAISAPSKSSYQARSTRKSEKSSATSTSSEGVGIRAAPSLTHLMHPMLKRLLKGLIVTALLMVGFKYVEHTSWGNDVETFVFKNLQLLLPSFGKDMPIVVVDMSKISGNKDQPTSRAELKETLTAIVAQQPTAVGIDVDFSPDVNGWIVDDDPKFFDFCLNLKQTSGVPIYLGVFRTIDEKADTWLGLSKYKDLAAALRAEGDTKRLPRWLQAKNSAERLPIMSAALAESYRPTRPDPALGLSRTVEIIANDSQGVERKGEDKMLFGLSLVNYSRLEQIENERQLTLRPDAVAESGKKFAGKIVILGDATAAQDQFNIPGREEPVAGVYLIACAAYSLAVEPLYELSTGARIVLDLAISILLMLWIEWLRARYVNQVEGPRFEKKKGQAILIAIAAIFVVGLIMTKFLHIMWFDFPLGCFALLLHPRVEHILGDFSKRLKAPNKRRRKQE